MQKNMVPIWDNLPDLSWKEKVCLLTFHLSKLEQIESPVSHSFENGQYIREMKLPAGSMLTGREHLQGHEMQLIKGSVILVAPEDRFRFNAYATMRTKPGFHAVVYCVTDLIARTIHPNPENIKDIDALERQWFGKPDPVIEAGRLIHQRLLS